MNKFSTNKLALNRGYIFLTGSTGLVGQYLIRDLLEQGHRLAVLVRPNKKFSAQARIEIIMRRWEKQLGTWLPRPIVIEGNIKNRNLNVSEEDRDWVTSNCDRLIHNAAILQFDGPDQNSEPWLTNLHGTRNVLDFAKSTNICELHYVSTAYVSGVCKSVFRESDFDQNQEFRNDYERSKFEAEKLVRETNGFDSKTIYRPAVIVGDSQTGFTASYHGLYVYLRLMATLIPLQPANRHGIRNTPIELPMNGDAPRNLVPVDWVSNVITKIVGDPKVHNQTYHLVPDEGLTARKLIEVCYEYFNSTGARFNESAESQKNENEFAKRYLDNIKVYSSYDKSDPKFDSQNVKQVCPDLNCPVIDREAIFRFLDFGIRDDWGKKKIAAVEIENWLDSHWQFIQNAASECEFPNDLNRREFGINILGPAGGQWRITTDGCGGLAYFRGLPVDSKHGNTPLLTIAEKEFDALDSHVDVARVWREFLSRFIKSDKSVENRLQLIG